jgi:hypothetical protein
LVGTLVYIPVVIVIRGNLKEYVSKRLDKRLEHLVKSKEYQPFDGCSMISGLTSTVVDYVPYNAANFHRQYERESMLHYVPFSYPQVSHSPDQRSEFGYRISGDEEMGESFENDGVIPHIGESDFVSSRDEHDDLEIIVDSPIIRTLVRDSSSKGAAFKPASSKNDELNILALYERGSLDRVENDGGVSRYDAGAYISSQGRDEHDDLEIIVDSPIIRTLVRDSSSKGAAFKPASSKNDELNILALYERGSLDRAEIDGGVSHNDEGDYISSQGRDEHDDLAIIVDSPIIRTLDRETSAKGVSFEHSSSMNDDYDINALYDRAAREDENK